MYKLLGRVDYSADVTKFVCVEGPEFGGHQVDFDLLMSRQRQYVSVSQEKESLDSYLPMRLRARER